MKRLFLLAALPLLLAAKPISYPMTVQDTVYGSVTIANVVPDPVHEDWIFVQCYVPTFDGTYVYAEWFLVTGAQTPIGPIPPTPFADGWKVPWHNGPADCSASQGWFRRNGFGNYVELAYTTFHVAAR